MTPKTIAAIALALVLGALPASAAHRSYDRPGSRGHDREANRSGHEPQQEKIDRLAHRLDHATSQLYSQATDRARHESWREWRAIRTLRRLERRADHFQTHVARHGAGSRRAQAAFRDLDCAYQAAAERRDDLRRSRQLRDEFARVDDLMDRLDHRIATLARHERHRENIRHRVDRERRHRSRDSRTHVAFHFGF